MSLSNHHEPEYIFDYIEGVERLVEVPNGTGGQTIDAIYAAELTMTLITNPAEIREIDILLTGAPSC